MAVGFRPTVVEPEGHVQSAFKTIEFGFSPFVPFTETFRMILTGGRGGASDFKVHADSEGDAGSDPDWTAAMEAYNAEGGSQGKILEDIENLPTSMIRQRSASMTEELANLLQGDHPIYTAYDTKHIAELEDLITIDWLHDSNNVWAWDGRSWETPGVTARRDVMGKQVQTHNKENIDMMATTEAQRDKLEYVLHRIAAQTSTRGTNLAGFVDNVEGIEVTKMVNQKYTQMLFNELAVVGDYTQGWLDTADRLAEQVLETYRAIGQGAADIIGIASETLEGTFGTGTPREVTAHGGDYDSREYMVKQMLDRFAEISVRNSGSIASYLWHQPLAMKGRSQAFPTGPARGTAQSTLVGFAKFTAHLTRTGTGASQTVSISNVIVEAHAIDIGGEWAGSGFRTQADYLAHLEAASSTGYGTLAQFLLWDRMVSLPTTMRSQMMIAGALAVGSGVGSAGAFTSQRGEMLGSSLRYQVDEMTRGAAGAGSVEAVQVLSSSKIAEGVKGQFEEFFEGEAVNKLFSDFYIKATRLSNSITDTWKRDVTSNMSSNLKTTISDVWAKELFDSGGIQGTKIGIPWFFYSGEDPMGYTRFTMRGLDRLLLVNIRRDEMRTGIGTQPAAGDLQGPPLQAMNAGGLLPASMGSGIRYGNIHGMRDGLESIMGGSSDYTQGRFPRWTVGGIKTKYPAQGGQPKAMSEGAIKQLRQPAAPAWYKSL